MAKNNKKNGWRSRRPFWGATISLLSSLLILWIPMHLAKIAFLPGSMAYVGLLFGGILILLSIMVYIYPNASTILGAFIIFVSVLSVMGALGGMFVGTILGIIGGSLCIAWQNVPVQNETKKELPIETTQPESEFVL
ncbi:DUF6114 domain-containing protein [Fredinandcohnia sp. 179-A 10B2 NHS]|uniref:DUF6114 domain-containing protein n=1 Tax=Fredinandcohnia sp. 179-A 10B2 NHS TaxID=3235176 RepID=UPI0039A1E20A